MQHKAYNNELGVLNLVRTSGDNNKLWHYVNCCCAIIFVTSRLGMSAIVVDFGSSTCKAGLAQDSAPYMFPSLMKYSRDEGERKSSWNVSDAKKKSSLPYFRQGIERVWRPIGPQGVNSWEHMEAICQYALFGPHIGTNSSGELPVCLSEPATFLFQPKSHEKISEIMFETLKVPSLYMGNQQKFALYSAGKTTGVVADLGAEVSWITSIVNGSINKDDIIRFSVHGKYLEEKFNESLSSHGYTFCTAEERDYIRRIKEKLMYVSKHADTEAVGDEYQKMDKTYEFPDGSRLDLGEEVFRVPEHIWEANGGLHKQILEAVRAQHEDCQWELRNNILVCGGSALLMGLEERLRSELSGACSDFRIISGSTNKITASWRGAADFARSHDFYNLCILKEDYDECGARVLNNLSGNCRNKAARH